MKHLPILISALLFSTTATTQIDVGGMVKNKVNQRVEQKTNEAIDKTLDKTEESAKDAAKGNKKKDKKGGDDTNNGSPEAPSGNSEGSSNSNGDGNISKATLKTYGKFDFVPGEKVMVTDNFSQVAVGDFPADWNTNSGGEIVTAEGKEGHWLMLSKEGVFIPDYITELPENFTMQFELICNEGFSFYSSAMGITFVPTNNRGKLNDFSRFSHPPFALRLHVHPEDAGGSQGWSKVEVWDGQGESLMHNEIVTSKFDEAKSSHVKVSIWRQKQRLRVYLNDEKIYDIPRAFDATSKYNTVVFNVDGMHKPEDRYLISNITLAQGAPDTRNKLITEGKFVTHGILFDSGSDRIKAESYGALKDIANVLIENPTVKVKIIGHTDSDGEDANNLELSKKRAAAVKETLSKEFAIDPSRMETDGKGESQPADKNDTPVGKANNRRVEFVKL